VGDPSAYEHFMRAPGRPSGCAQYAGDGIHGASAGGLWQAVVFGFAGSALFLVKINNGTPIQPCHTGGNESRSRSTSMEKNSPLMSIHDLSTDWVTVKLD